MGLIIAGMAILLLALGALARVLVSARRLTRDLDALIVDQAAQRDHASTDLERIQQAVRACVTTDVIPLDVTKARRR